MSNNLQRWPVASIVEFFLKNPKGTIRMTTTDKTDWLSNTNNTLTIARREYKLSFKEISKGVHEASLK